MPLFCVMIQSSSPTSSGSPKLYRHSVPENIGGGSVLENQWLRRIIFAFFLATLVSSSHVPAGAQWQNLPSSSIPKTKDGKPNLAAPAPRKPDGRPDLSGIWSGDFEYVKRYLRADMVADFAAGFQAGEFPVQPWAEALTKERTTGGEWPGTRCLPPGIAMLDAGAAVNPLKIIQEPSLMVVLYESFGVSRQIFLDGRTLAKDANPTWLGYSVGLWEDDVLVVDSTGFNGKTWLDVAGHPSTEALHITERFRRRDFGHLDLQLTVDDPKAYTKPWTVALPLNLNFDGDLLEFVCNENEKDAKHIGNK
jgi:hypothetical protein